MDSGDVVQRSFRELCLELNGEGEQDIRPVLPLDGVIPMNEDTDEEGLHIDQDEEKRQQRPKHMQLSRG